MIPMFGRKKKKEEDQSLCHKCGGYVKRKVARKAVLHTAAFLIAPGIGNAVVEIGARVLDAADLADTFGD